jgi:ABC-type phosphate/phosphonate transport system substrate-binding protein
MERPLTIGAVAYDPKVVTIWEGFARYLGERGLRIDTVLFTNYETQVEAHLDGVVDVAWNSPLAWVRSARLARARGSQVSPLVMRDADRGLTSAVVVRTEDGPADVAALAGRRVAVGAVDSPQATLIPLQHLRDLTIEVEPVRHDVFAGKHGDHGTAERLELASLVRGEVEAATVLSSTIEAATDEGVIEPGQVTVIERTPAFDHCVMTVAPHAPAEETALLGKLLLAMSIEDAEAKTLCELEGLKRWEPGRDTGFGMLERAVDAVGFYDAEGRITAQDYEPLGI